MVAPWYDCAVGEPDVTATLVPRTIAPLRTEGRLSRRVVLAARLFVAMVLWTVALTATLAYTPLGGEYRPHFTAGLMRQLGVAVVAIGLGLAAVEAIQRRAFSAAALPTAAVIFEAVAAFLLGLLVHAVPDTSVPGPLSISLVGVWLVLFAAIVPLSPRYTWMGATLVALAEPVAFASTLALDPTRPTPPVALFAWRMIPIAITVTLAYPLANLLRRMKAAASAARSLGEYQLIRRIGRGGMAEVWEAEHRMLARRAAVKVVRGEWLEDRQRDAETILQRFQREVGATSALSSPHTIFVYDFGRAEDGTFYYVMERLDGIDLHSMIRRFGKLPPERVVFLLLQMCHSLAEAHHAGLVHRDVKPANVFVCRYGLERDFVKVLDFGLVKGDPPGHEHQSLTREGAHTGTPAFIAPEIARGFVADADGRADLYGVGCVAYWLLTGKLVFPLGPAMQMITSHAHEVPEPPSERGGVQVPAELEAIVMKLLEKEPRRSLRERARASGGASSDGARGAVVGGGARGVVGRESPSPRILVQRRTPPLRRRRIHCAGARSAAAQRPAS